MNENSVIVRIDLNLIRCEFGRWASANDNFDTVPSHSYVIARIIALEGVV